MAYFNPEQHLVTKGGKKFINMAGLFAKLADDSKPLMGIETEMLDWGEESGTAKCKARVKVDAGEGRIAEYEGHGEANLNNVAGGVVAQALPRMAESRAIVRAMRWATRSEYTAAEEIN